jgi:hypothetical protein
MDEQKALAKLIDVLHDVDEYESLYDRRWGRTSGASYVAQDGLASQLKILEDDARRGVRIAADIARAMGETDLVAACAFHEQGQYGAHPYAIARAAIVELCAVLEQRDELDDILGPRGPQLSARSLHPLVWSAAALLWDDGYRRQAVQTAASALEGHLQGLAGPQVSGVDLAQLFSTAPPTAKFAVRLRLPLDETSKTYESAQAGAGFLIRGVMGAIRNLVSHDGWPHPDEQEGLEMLAVLSYVAHLVDRASTDDVVDGLAGSSS